MCQIWTVAANSSKDKHVKIFFDYLERIRITFMDFIHNFDLISWSIIGFPWAMGENCKQGREVYRSQENPQQCMCT
jgi:hypothetical protein